MPPRTSRRRSLNPTAFIDLAEKIISSNHVNETILRRIISGLYFSLFNYWAFTRFYRGKKGKGPRQDKYPQHEFYLDMIDKGAEKELLELIYYRVAADHHIDNPTEVRIYLSKNITFGKRKIEITPSTVKKLINLAANLAKIIQPSHPEKTCEEEH